MYRSRKEVEFFIFGLIMGATICTSIYEINNVKMKRAYYQMQLDLEDSLNINKIHHKKYFV